jgi:uncharacterized protein
MDRVTHFEIPTDRPEQSMEFYNKSFGWNYHRFGEHEYWLAFTGDKTSPGIDGAIIKKRHPEQPLTNSISVKNINETIKAIENNGGTIVVPVTAMPGVGWLAYFKDPDQNIFGIIQDDPSAA